MSDVKDPDTIEDVSAEVEQSESLEEAMKEAVEAVEKRERGGSEPPEAAVEVEVESAPKDKKRDANEAVTEALIKAKEELEQVLEQTREETKRFREKWLRSAADLENYKKRAARERDDVVKFANERLLKDLVVVVDDLDRTLEVLGTAEGDAGVTAVIEGVRMVHKKFLTQLEKHGVTTFDAVGQVFDPGVHEAVQQVHSADVPMGGVAAELRRGFMLSGRLLRPAMVTVSLGPAPEAASEPAEDSGE